MFAGRVLHPNVKENPFFSSFNCKVNYRHLVLHTLSSQDDTENMNGYSKTIARFNNMLNKGKIHSNLRHKTLLKQCKI